MYMYASIFHWQPLLNGYSGFYPRSYIELIEMMRAFPSDEAIAYLKRREVDLIVLHGTYMKPDAFGALAAALNARPGYAGRGGVPGGRRPGHRLQAEALHTRVNGTAISPVRANAASTTRRCVAVSRGGPTGVPRPNGTTSVRGAVSRDEISGITESITVAIPRCSSAEATRLTVW